MRTDVTFPSAGLRLAGHLYTSDTRGSAIVVGHPGTGVKEQAAGLYAERLAALGYTTLTYDAAYQGESEGEPRGLEDPAQRVEDLKAAVSFLTTRDEVAPDRIGVLGICASGGYGFAAAGTDHRIKALATVSGVDIARQFRFGADGNQDPAVLQGMLDAAATARTTEAHGKGTQFFDVFAKTEEEARQGGRHVLEGWRYYCTPRAMHPRSTKSMPWASVDRMITFDAFRAIDLIAPRPLLMIVGREAVTSWMAVEAYQRAQTPKELHWIDGATHVDLYDKNEYVTPAVTKLADFFAQL